MAQVTIQALGHRRVAPDQVTVQIVASESGVSAATIYRRNDLFALVQGINPHLQRRPIESVHEQEATRLRRELGEARKETDYYQKESGIAKLGDRWLQQENVQLRKQMLGLQRRVKMLEEQMTKCSCGNWEHQTL